MDSWNESPSGGFHSGKRNGVAASLSRPAVVIVVCLATVVLTLSARVDVAELDSRLRAVNRAIVGARIGLRVESF